MNQKVDIHQLRLSLHRHKNQKECYHKETECGVTVEITNNEVFTVKVSNKGRQLPNTVEIFINIIILITRLELVDVMIKCASTIGAV